MKKLKPPALVALMYLSEFDMLVITSKIIRRARSKTAKKLFQNVACRFSILLSQLGYKLSTVYSQTSFIRSRLSGFFDHPDLPL